MEVLAIQAEKELWLLFHKWIVPIRFLFTQMVKYTLQILEIIELERLIRVERFGQLLELVLKGTVEMEWMQKDLHSTFQNQFLFIQMEKYLFQILTIIEFEKLINQV